MKTVTVFFLIFFSLSVSANSIKIGYIDTNEVIINLSQYQKNIDAISNEFEIKKSELLNLFDHIELLKSKIENDQKNNITPKDDEIQNIITLENSFKSETEFWQNSFNNRKIELLQEIEILINITIKDLAIREEFDLIFYDNVAFVSDKVNITQEIIDEIENNQ